MRKVKSSGNVKTNSNVKTNPTQLNGVGVFFRGSVRKLL
ncbi:hypothetical protein CAter10_4836 [Collimonas arenae]|nr:hypothetical protein CAter10_4836 [Collimonas arenae]